VAVLPAGHPFRRHSENLRAVKAGRKQAERAHKSAIRRADAAAIGFTARIHQLLIGLLAEAQLRVIVNDPDGFNDKERRLLMQERSQRTAGCARSISPFGDITRSCCTMRSTT